MTTNWSRWTSGAYSTEDCYETFCPACKRNRRWIWEDDDDFCPSSQQSSQPANHGEEENPFEEDEDASTSDYKSDHKLSIRLTSLEEKRIDLEMLKEKKRNFELRHVMKYARTFSGPEESSISIRFRSIKRPKKNQIYHSTHYANLRSFCHQIESGSKGRTPHEKYKKAKQLLAVEELNSGTITGWKKTPPKTGLPSKIFWIDF